MYRIVLDISFCKDGTCLVLLLSMYYDCSPYIYSTALRQSGQVMARDGVLEFCLPK